MLEGKRVVAIRDRARRGRFIKAIARDMGVSRNTVRRYVRQDLMAGAQTRPRARRLNDRLRNELRKRIGDARRWDTTGVQHWLAEQSVVASARTLRREVARLREEETRARRHEQVSESLARDMESVRQTAWQLGASDHDELESELTLHLAKLLPRRHRADNWNAFVRSSLWRRALNWLRRRALETKYLTSLDAPIELVDSEIVTLHEVVGRLDHSVDGRLALKRIRRSLPTPDRRVLDAVAANDFNQVRAAIELGMHRNSVGKALRRIRAAVTRRNWLYPDLC